MTEESGGGVSVSRLTALLRRNAKMLKAQDKKLAEQQKTIDRQAAALGEIRRTEYVAESDLLFRRDVRGILRRLDGGAE